MGVDLRERKLRELEESIKRSRELLQSGEVEGPALVYFENLLKDSEEEVMEILLLDKWVDNEQSEK